MFSNSWWSDVAASWHPEPNEGLYQWIGLRENLQETMVTIKYGVFTIKYGVFL